MTTYTKGIFMFARNKYDSIKFLKFADDFYYLDQSEPVNTFNMFKQEIVDRLRGKPNGAYVMDIRKSPVSNTLKTRIRKIA